jgi:hypothetical protein
MKKKNNILKYSRKVSLEIPPEWKAENLYKFGFGIYEKTWSTTPKKKIHVKFAFATEYQKNVSC